MNALINQHQVCGVTNVVSMNRCGKCKSQNLNNWEKQTRSADEPMTQFFNCLDCGQSWRDQGGNGNDSS